MRRHDRHGRLATRIDAEAFHEIVCAENLVSAKLDPGFGLRVDSPGLLDLSFANDGRVVLVPFLLLHAAMLLVRETSPYIWPAWLPPLREHVALEIEERLDPWVKSLVVARFANEECFKLFGRNAQAHALAHRAREFGFLGAAPTDEAMRAIAPYVYAQRFSRGRRVSIDDAGGAAGAAILARSASSVRADLGDAERADAARRWFDLDAYGAGLEEGPCDVSIVTGSRRGDGAVRIAIGAEPGSGERRVAVATPIPPAVMVSFDPGDGSATQHLAVAAPPANARRSGLPAITVVGGSSGRIALVVRSDYLGSDDADADAAIAMSLRLSEQGFTPAVVPANHLRADNYDLIHVFGVRAAVAIEPELDRLGVPRPVVLSPYADDIALEAEWGASIASSTLANAPDEMQRSIYFDAIGQRRLEFTGAKRGTASLDVGAAVRRAAVVIASSEAEERRLRDEFGARQCRVVPGVLAAEPEAADVATLVGADDFILVHAPMEPRCNQFPLARAAAELGYPLVVVGSVQDTAFYGECCAVLGDLGIWIGSDQLGAAELAGLYARCRVFADASWSSNGLHRLLRAGSMGAALVAPSSGYAGSVWPGLARIVDPASMPSVREGLREAWQRAPELGPATASRTIEVADPFKSLVGVVTGYQVAASAVPSRT